MYNANFNAHDDKTIFWIFNYYLKDYHDFLVIKPGEKISNPFLSESQATPSFNIFKQKSGKWKYYDFATDHLGDVYDLVQRLFNLSFREAKYKIIRDMEEIAKYVSEAESLLQKTDNKNLNKSIYNMDLEEKSYSIMTREFSEEDKLFWFTKYKISRDVLIRFNVQAVSTFNINGKVITPMGITYAYDIGEGYKIYQPTNRDYKFIYVGKKEEKFIFGYKQLPENGSIVFITGGEKDVLTISGQGYSAICLNSETANLPDWLYEDLKQRFQKIVILYDNDTTGIEQSDKLCKKFGLINAALPQCENAKDISDFISLGFSFEDLLYEILPGKPNSSYSLKTFDSLAVRGNFLKPIKKLWGCFVLEGSLILFPADRGIGKTFLMLELALAVAHEAPSFCGEIIELHGNTIYINLELAEEQISRRIYNLQKHLPGRGNRFKAYCLTILSNFEKQLSNVEKIIKEKEAVLIIIDNMRAASSHIDNEKNKAVVGFVQRLKEILANQKCAIIVVHHTKKGTQFQRLSSDMQSGAGALTDLVDGDFFLARSTQNKNYRLLKRLKSRSCEEQEDAKLLFFNPQTQWFELKEESVREADHLSFEKGESEKAKETEEMKILYAQGKTLEEIANQFGVNKSTVSRRINK